MHEMKSELAMARLGAPLLPTESKEGWTVESKAAILKYFEDRRANIDRGKDAPDVGLARGLDAWGITRGGELYNLVMNASRELDALHSL